MNSEELYKKYKASLDRIYQKQYDFENKLNDFSELEEQINILEKYMIELFDAGQQDMFYWDYCPFNVYEYHYENRLKEFKEKITGSSESDFIDTELSEINDSFYISDEQRKFTDNVSTLTRDKELHLWFSAILDVPIINHDLALRIFISQKRKTEFLKYRQEDISLSQNNKFTDSTENEFLEDLSNSTKAMQIVYLHELGILDFLHEKMNKDMIFNANKLAEVISSFTGIGSRTVQSYINPIYTKDAIQEKNPLKPNSIKRARSKLSEWGFSNKETT